MDREQFQLANYFQVNRASEVIFQFKDLPLPNEGGSVGTFEANWSRRFELQLGEKGTHPSSCYRLHSQEASSLRCDRTLSWTREEKERHILLKWTINDILEKLLLQFCDKIIMQEEIIKSVLLMSYKCFAYL